MTRGSSILLTKLHSFSPLSLSTFPFTGVVPTFTATGYKPPVDFPPMMESLRSSWGYDCQTLKPLPLVRYWITPPHLLELTRKVVTYEYRSKRPRVLYFLFTWLMLLIFHIDKKLFISRVSLNTAQLILHRAVALVTGGYNRVQDDPTCKDKIWSEIFSHGAPSFRGNWKFIEYI